MTTPWKPPAPGALDDTPWPEKLVARAVEPGDADDRLHGYAVLGDLARHYEHSDVVYLAITGELPDEEISSLFRIALACHAPLSVAHAPTHVAVLSRICAGALASAIAAGSLVLADRARFLLESHARFLAWLGCPEGAPPQTYVDASHAQWLASLRAVAGDRVPALAFPLTRAAASIAILFACGLRDAGQLEAAIVAGSLPGLLAEALRASPADLGRYPVKLPPFQYVEDHAT